MLECFLTLTIFLNGNIYTNDPERPRAEAIVVRSGKIVHVGSNVRAEARPEAEPVEVIDLAGRTVVPGFVDAHGHLGSLGALEKGALDLRDARSWAEVVAAVKERAALAKPGEWIFGSRWDHESWPERALPTRDALDAAAPENPVLLTRIDGHMAIANARALAAAGVTAATANPPGGALGRAEGTREPTGILIDNAIDLVAAKAPAGGAGSPAYEDLVLAAQARCLSVGLTAVHDAGIAPAEAEALVRLAESGRLKLRVHAMVAASEAGLAWIEGRPPLVRAGPRGRLSVRAVKVIGDGAMGSRGAWLLAPYADAPAQGWVGLPVTSRSDLERIVARASKAGYQVAVHAIGDRANQVALDALASAPRALRPRIEHAQLVAPADIPRFAALGVIASMQPTHATSDMRWAERRLGRERLVGAYAWAKVLRAGARLALGSDFPVENPEPLEGFYAAIARRDRAGEPPGGWLPEERLGREEALRGFTEWAAHAAFDEDRAGRLAPGLDADFVVLSRDILVCDPREVLDTKVEMTIAAGEIVFRR